MSYQDVSNPSRTDDDIDGDRSSTSAAGAARDEARQVGASTKEQGAAVAGSAMESGKQVAAEAKEQARQVTDEARTQLRGLVRHSREELRAQASAQTSRAAATMQTLSQQLAALAQGRTEDAGALADYVSQSGEKIGDFARRWQDGGVDTVVGDARGFARRRPGLFLLGAVAAGFAAGRLIRGAQAAGDRPDDADSPTVGRNGAMLGSAGGPPPALSAGRDMNAPPPTPPMPQTSRVHTDAAVGAGYADSPMQEGSDADWLSGGGAVGEA